MKKYVLFVLLFLPLLGFSQEEVKIEGYVFENNNRGYLNDVKILITEKKTGMVMDSVRSNVDGFFSTKLPANMSFDITGIKDLFHPTSQELNTHSNSHGKVFVKMRLDRAPGYIFDVTLAERKVHIDSVANAIEGAWIEIYNNTTKKEVLSLKDFPNYNFRFTFHQGNHYTMLLRKKGYFTKRLEAFVNVDGCILCFEGIDDLQNITDNLTEGFEMGTILANIEMDKAEMGSTFNVKNIYYDYNSYKLRPDAKLELDKLKQILLDNQSLVVELGSHTDTRGKKDYNLTLSQKRAESAVNYLVNAGIKEYRIKARGYGESDPKIDCGQDCDEVEHQNNRRTEIKVVGFLKVDPNATKTLVDLKFDDNFDETLKEIQEGDVIQIAPGQAIPDEIRRQIEKDTGHKIGGDEKKDKVPGPEDNDEPRPEEDIQMQKSEVISGEQKAPEKRSMAAEETRRARLEQELKTGKKEIRYEDYEVPSDFNGFTIELFRKKGIDFSEEVSRNRNNMLLEKMDDGTISHLFGKFDELTKALEIMNGLSKIYPDLRIIEFENGKRK